LQNGSLSVESKPGKGTSFTVIIPYQISTEQIGVAPQAVAPAFNEAPVFSNVSILVAEDNEMNQSLIRHLFKNWNISFDMASNGSEAITMLRQKEYNLILMDIQMPVMDGYTATQEIRNTLGITTPIIAMTAHAFAGEREKCLSYGMNDYISKPIREEQLLQQIVHFAGSSPAAKKSATIGSGFNTSYQFIDLHYMKEISGGNKQYEKTVTEQFIEMVPDAIEAIQKAWQENNLPLLRSTAHNLKTTISVMGLHDKLGTTLDALEHNNLTATTFEQHFAVLTAACTGAIAEAKAFLAELH
jgi:CheY-like chemotaxis protein